MLIIKMYRDIFMIVEYLLNKVFPCLCGRSFFGFIKELRYYRDFTESTSSKEVYPQNMQMKMKELIPTFSCNIHPSG